MTIKKLILAGNEKKVVRENKLKTFYLNFIKNKNIIQTSIYAGLLFDHLLFNLEKADIVLAASIMKLLLLFLLLLF